MLYSSIRVLIGFILSSVVSNQGIAAPVITSSYDYVPNELRVMSAFSQNKNKKEKELSDKALSETQKKGIVEGKAVVDSMLHHTTSDNNFVPLIDDMVKQNQKIINRIYQTGPNAVNNSGPELYYFISFSMPDAIIKSYVLDAIWSGGVLVVRGVPRGMTIARFLQQYILPLVKYKGDHAKIQINPNLYEMYDVQVVPTILITNGKKYENQCERIVINSKSVDYQSCKKINSMSYWKISGNVTTPWALDMLKDNGAPTQLFMNRMQRLNKTSQKNEEGFHGDWQKAQLPTSNDIVLSFLAKYGLQQGFDGLISKKNGHANAL